jgi:hypothetical protein
MTAKRQARHMIIPRVHYQMHANERTTGLIRKRMRKIGFAPWTGFPSIDDPTQDDETFAQQRQRLRWALSLPDDDDDVIPIEPM